jgi:hypothetical protein
MVGQQTSERKELERALALAPDHVETAGNS